MDPRHQQRAGLLAILNRKITRDGLELHPGLVLFLHNVRPDAQRVLFQATLDYLDGRDDLINTVLEVDVDPTTAALLDPNRRLDEVTWAQVCDQLRPQFREFPLP
ncbi:MAG: hypothetical protein R3F62_17190 [Planctomycetota bacterium]